MPSHGQGVSGVAERELAKRQAAINEALQLIQEGDVLRSGEELESAIASYRSAIELLPRAPATESIRSSAIDKYSMAAVEWAKALAAGGRYEDASATVEGILVPGIAPDYQPALDLREQLADPDYHNPALTPEHVKRVDEVVKLITQAKGLVALGRYDEAKRAYNDVLRIDRYNTAARRGLEGIERKISDYHDASRDHTRAKMLRMVDEGWETEVLAPNLELESLAGTDVGSGVRKSSVARKVKTIVIPRIEFFEAKLREVAEFLTAQSKLLDTSPGGNKGINIVLDSSGEAAALGDRRISLSMSGLPLESVLRYVTDLTGTRFRVEEFAVKITDRGESGEGSLRTKSFRVPPNFISSSPDGGAAAADLNPFAAPDAGDGGSGLVLKRLSAKEFLEQSGITFPEGADAAFIATTSKLVVTNSEEQLDLVEQMVQTAFERSANQIKIDVIMLDTTENALNELGFDTLVGGFNVAGSDRVFASGGTAGNMATPGAVFPGGPAGAPGDYSFLNPVTGAPVGMNPLTAGNRSAAQFTELENSIDALLLADNSVQVGNLSPGVFSVAGAFTDPQFQTVIRGLNQKKGIDVTMSPSVVTRSGQRASMKVIREFPYPTEFDPPEIPDSFGYIPSGDALFAVDLFPGEEFTVAATPATPTAFDVREVGNTIEVEPIIGPDGKTVELNLLVKAEEFEGFIDYGEPIAGNFGTNVTENRILMPVFRSVKESLQVSVWDGQTVVIGGLMQQEILDGEDKTPIFGDLPVVGGLFRSKVENTISRAIIFMVRVNIIDPGGNTIRGQAAN